MIFDNGILLTLNLFCCWIIFLSSLGMFCPDLFINTIIINYFILYKNILILFK